MSSNMIDEMFATADQELARVKALQEDARQALQLVNEEVTKWQRVINALRPPQVIEQKGNTKAPTHARGAISEVKLDEYVVKLREQFAIGVEFLTRDAHGVFDVSMSRTSQALAQLRERGDIRLAGRAPGKGVIPLWALTPQSEFAEHDHNEASDKPDNGETAEPSLSLVSGEGREEEDHSWRA